MRRNSALASLSLHLARITNIDKRFKVAASTLAEHASSNSSGPARHTRKLACKRPLAEQKPASRSCDVVIDITSLVS